MRPPRESRVPAGFPRRNTVERAAIDAVRIGSVKAERATWRCVVPTVMVLLTALWAVLMKLTVPSVQFVT